MGFYFVEISTKSKNSAHQRIGTRKLDLLMLSDGLITREWPCIWRCAVSFDVIGSDLWRCHFHYPLDLGPISFVASSRLAVAQFHYSIGKCALAFLNQNMDDFHTFF